jgi:opacity protein-like surface antigen
MSNRRKTAAIGVVLAAFALAASPPRHAAAQTTPAKTDTIKKARVDTSAKRIKIKKDTTVRTAGGEVCLPVECVTIEPGMVPANVVIDREAYAREAQRVLDSIDAAAGLQREILRIENRVAAERTRAFFDSIARVDAERAAAQLAMKRHLARGFYIGVAGGTSMPQRAIRNGYTGGWNTTVPFGWDASDLPLGIRADFAFDRLHGTQVRDAGYAVIASSGDVSIWSLNLDGKLRFRAPGAPGRTHLYVLGGVGAHKVTDGIYGTSGVDAGRSLGFNSAKTNFGWNVGGGLSAQWGPTELFIESRFFQIKTNMAYHMNGGVGTYASYTPIVIGLQWF